ncbi:TniQ family protein [Nocardia takedensis]
MSTRTFPIRVPPLPGEAIDSWLEALAARHHASWRDLLDAVGLAQPRSTVSSWIARPTATETAALATATATACDTIAASTLARYHGIALRIEPLSRTLDKTFPWSPCSWSRFCPHCLAETSGRWQLRWRLGWSFACLRHHRLLADTCTGCGLRQRRLPLSAGVVPAPGRCASPVPGSVGRAPARCGADLTLTETLTLDPDHPALRAQHTIDDIISTGKADFGVYAAAPQLTEAALTDIRIVAIRVLHLANTPSLADAVPADLHDAYTHTEARSGSPERMSLTAVSAAVGVTAALAGLGARDAHRGGKALRWLVTHARASGSKIVASTIGRDASPVLEAVQLKALAPTMTPTDQLRHRIIDPLPRRAGPNTASRASALTRAVPAMLWTAWSLRLALPRPQQPQLRPAVSIALLLTATSLSISAAAQALGGHADNYQVIRAVTLLANCEHWHDIRHALTRMADNLIDTGTPIDYQRRRSLDYTDLLPDDFWQRICREYGAATLNLRSAKWARAYLFETISGLPADSNITNLPDNHRHRASEFARNLTPELAARLEEHARDFLAGHHIHDEPPSWQPPTDLFDDLHLPGPDPAKIDIERLHRLIRHEDRTLGQAARVLGTTRDTIRHVLETHPAPFIAPTDTRTAYLAVKAALPADKLADLYQHQRLSTSAIAERVGTYPDVINRLVRDYGIPLRGMGRQTPHIDADWFREQYLVHGRTLTDLAAEAGTTWVTLTNYAQRHDIPLRRSTYYYLRRSPATEEEVAAAPPLLRPVLLVMGGYGWLNDFAAATLHPSLTAAAEHLGMTPSVLTQRIRELEIAFGDEPLLIRAKIGIPMTLTPHGKAVLDAIHQSRPHPSPDQEAAAHHTAPQKCHRSETTPQ